MTLDEFIQSAVEGNEPPAGLNNTLTTLWQARAGQWDNAHDSCQNLPDPDGAWIHAWLHRQEGDLSNASYWYHHRARKTNALHHTRRRMGKHHTHPLQILNHQARNHLKSPPTCHLPTCPT